MCENENQEINEQESNGELIEFEETLPVIIDKSQAIADELMDTEDPQKMQELINLFNIQAKKKNIHRAVKVNDLLDNIVNTLYTRMLSDPDKFANFELVSYLERLDAYSEKITSKEANPNDNSLINLTQNNQINIINDSGLNTNSRKHVTEAVRKILENLNKETPNIIEGNENND